MQNRFVTSRKMRGMLSVDVDLIRLHRPRVIVAACVAQSYALRALIVSIGYLPLWSGMSTAASFLL